MALVTKLDEYERFRLKRLIEELKEVKGEGTTLVTIAIKAGANVSGTLSMVKDELGTATNIKSAQTSKKRLRRLALRSIGLKKTMSPVNPLMDW